MTEVIDQTWTIEEGECGPELCLGEDSGGFPIVNKGMWGEGQMEMARAAPEMARLLLVAEAILRDDAGRELLADEIVTVLCAAGALPSEPTYCPHGVMVGIRCAPCEDGT